MKFCQFVVAFLLAFTSVAAETPLAGNHRPPRKVEYAGAVPVNSGMLEIIVPPGSSKVVCFAGRELSRLLRNRLGFDVPVQEKTTAGKRSIILGVNVLSRAAGIDDSKLCRDAFFIRSAGGDIFILGRDDGKADPETALQKNKLAQYFERGTLFGVYDFLERFAGLRFYFPGKYGTVIPHGPLSLPEKIDIFDRPDFEIRTLDMETSVWTESPQTISRPRLDRNNYPSYRGQLHPEKFLAGFRLRTQTLLLPNCHGLAFLSLAERFGKSHPEYFALDDNHVRLTDPKRPHPFPLCYSGGLRGAVLEDAKAYLSGKSPESRGIPRKEWHWHGQSEGVFDLQPQDSFYNCRCEKCKGLKTSRQVSDHVWNFFIDVAEGVQQSGTPGFLQVMSYSPYHLIPARKIPGNVLVQVAVTGPWMVGGKTNQDEVVKAWAEKSGNPVLLWSYCGKYGAGVLPGIPHFTPRRIGTYYKQIAPYVFGARLLTSGDYYIFSALNQYVFAKVGWDNSTDVDALLKEYYQLLFGAGAGEMQKSFELLEELWCSANGKLVESVVGPVIAPPSEYELFEVYYSPAALKELNHSFDRAETLAAADPEALERIRFMRWNFLGRLEEAAADYFKRSSAIRDFSCRGKRFGDGKIDWNAVPIIYLQRVDGGGTGDESTVQMALTPETLALRFRGTEPELTKVASAASDAPEKLWSRDGIEWFLNPSGDRKDYYQIIVNSAGVCSIARGRMVGSSRKLKPEAVAGLESRVRRDKAAWVCEIDIPLSSLPGWDENKMLCNIIRNQVKPGVGARYSWSPFIGRTNHDPEKFGSVDFAGRERKQLLEDGDFSAPSNGRNVFGPWIAQWRIPAGCGVTHDRSTFISGPNSLRLTSSGTERWYQIKQEVKLKPSTRYRLSYYIRLNNVVPNNVESGVCVNIWTDRNRWFPKNKLTGSTPWIRQSFEFTTASDEKTTAYVRPFLLGCSGSANFDDIRLEELN